ncbi:MAG: hypothetical protein K8T25_00140 [Planctomycetia bacterium]|nr:hypothetical protein [Planctomycetia bacterium]
MLKLRGGTNPFYALLVIAGVVFAITACAYGVMAFRQARPDSQALATSDTSLMGILDRHGIWILGGEVLLVGVLTIGAIGTDSYWQSKVEQQKTASQLPNSPSSSTTTFADNIQPADKGVTQ